MKKNTNIENEKPNQTEKAESKQTGSFKKVFSQREHSEFHNCHTEDSVKQDVAFLRLVYGEGFTISESDVTQEFVYKLKVTIITMNFNE